MPRLARSTASAASLLAPTALLLVASGAIGQAADSRELEVLPLEEETRIALSAAPEHLRAGAGVEVLTSDGFVQVRRSENGFTCVVNRDHPLSRKPTCYDAEGTETILPKVKFIGELMLEGIDIGEIHRRVQDKFDRGEFIAPRRAGVAYMLTREIRNYNPQTGQTGTFPPHIMFYAPDLTNEDIATSWPARTEHPWLPFVAYQGPHGFLVVVVPES